MSKYNYHLTGQNSDFAKLWQKSPTIGFTVADLVHGGIEIMKHKVLGWSFDLHLSESCTQNIIKGLSIETHGSDKGTITVIVIKLLPRATIGIARIRNELRVTDI